MEQVGATVKAIGDLVDTVVKLPVAEPAMAPMGKPGRRACGPVTPSRR
jgi:hypothetical protein